LKFLPANHSIGRLCSHINKPDDDRRRLNAIIERICNRMDTPRRLVAP
jgi:hypothetical protein